MVTRFDRYLFRELLLPTLAGLAGGLLLMLGDFLYANLPSFAEWHVPWSQVVRLIALKTPEKLLLALPFAVLLGACWTLTRLAREGELTAIRLGGLSLPRALGSVFALGLVVSAVCWGLLETVVPAANRAAHQAVRSFVFAQPLPTVRENMVFHVPPSYFVYVGRASPDGTLENLMIYDQTHGAHPVVLLADRGRVTPTEWILENGRMHFYRADGTQEQTVWFAEERVPIRAGLDFWAQQRVPSEMTSRELQKSVRVYTDLGLSREARHLLVELHSKFALPWAALVAVWLAAPLSLRFARSGSYMGLFLALLLGGAYNVLFAWGRTLGDTGVLAPALGVWMNTAGFALGGALLLSRQR